MQMLSHLLEPRLWVHAVNLDHGSLQLQICADAFLVNGRAEIAFRLPSLVAVSIEERKCKSQNPEACKICSQPELSDLY